MITHLTDYTMEVPQMIMFHLFMSRGSLRHCHLEGIRLVGNKPGKSEIGGLDLIKNTYSNI